MPAISNFVTNEIIATRYLFLERSFAWLGRRYIYIYIYIRTGDTSVFGSMHGRLYLRKKDKVFNFVGGPRVDPNCTRHRGHRVSTHASKPGPREDCRRYLRFETTLSNNDSFEILIFVRKRNGL